MHKGGPYAVLCTTSSLLYILSLVFCRHFWLFDAMFYKTYRAVTCFQVVHQLQATMAYDLQ